MCANCQTSQRSILSKIQNQLNIQTFTNLSRAPFWNFQTFPFNILRATVLPDEIIWPISIQKSISSQLSNLQGKLDPLQQQFSKATRALTAGKFQGSSDNQECSLGWTRLRKEYKIFNYNIKCRSLYMHRRLNILWFEFWFVTQS